MRSDTEISVGETVVLLKVQIWGAFWIFGLQIPNLYMGAVKRLVDNRKGE